MGGVGPAARDEFAPDSPLQRRVLCEPLFNARQTAAAEGARPLGAVVVKGYAEPVPIWGLD